MKKFMSLLMAIVMVFTLATPVKADNYTITIENENSGHTYEAYQIFTGDLEGGNKVLTNIEWGSSVSAKEGSTLPDVYTTAKALEDGTLTLDALLAQINLSNPIATDDTVSEGKYELTGLVAGYYLVKDKDGSLTNDHDAYTDYIVKVVNSVTVTPKSVFPTVDKQVQDEAADKDVNSTDNNGWGETADHDINETFQFKLIATLPSSSQYAAYDTYKVVFTDKMSAGVTFENIDSVTVDGETVTDYACTAKKGDAGKTWTLTIANIKGIAGVDLTDGAIIEVIYNAHLNEAAKIANEKENKNTVSLQYSNNPNASGAGETNELGKTPEDHVWVFTYLVDGTKVDGDEKEDGKYTKPLANAEFVFYKKVGETKHYVVLDSNNKVQGWTTDLENLPEGIVGETTIASDSNGKFSIVGLDAGTYYLEETKAPDGYNLLTGPKTVVITAQHKETSTTTAETLNATATPNVSATVENFSGATLPETGGMGTTLFYVFGSLLAVGAIVLLVTKKRMNEE